MAPLLWVSTYAPGVDATVVATVEIAAEGNRAARGGAALQIQLRGPVALFRGDVLDGLQIDRNPEFNGWLTSQRRRFRGHHAAMLERRAK